MNTFIQTIQAGSLIQKTFFLMVCGILSVFLVQVVFYIIIKLWPRKKDEKTQA